MFLIRQRHPIARRTPLKRSTKPLKRTWIKYKPKRSRVLKSGRIILDGAHMEALRLEIFERSDGQCEWKWKRVRCASRITWDTMIMHHAKFRSHGGSDSMRNCRGICKTCDDRIHPGPQWSQR